MLKEFHKGIDSLYLSYKGIIKDGILRELEEKKELAQSEDLLKQIMARMTINEHNFEVLSKGSEYYSFILVDNWYRIQISKSGKMKTPSLYIQISSELLNCFGMNEIMEDIKKIVLFILSNSNDATISRVDLFVDFLTDKNLEEIDKKEWLLRAENIHSYWKNEVFTG